MCRGGVGSRWRLTGLGGCVLWFCAALNVRSAASLELPRKLGERVLALQGWGFENGARAELSPGLSPLAVGGLVLHFVFFWEIKV